MTGTDARAIRTVSGLHGRAVAPPSKSVTQRALIAASLAPGMSRLRRPLLAEDSLLLIAALQACGVPVSVLGAGEAAAIEVDGRPELSRRDAPPLFLGNAGTAMRFLAARLAAARSAFTLDGSERMRQRPIGDLLQALRNLGAAAESIGGNGCPPVRVGGRGLRGGPVRVRGGTSSQFLSALLLAGPAAEAGLDIEIEGDLVSRPYADLTLAVMRRFGVSATPDPPSGVVQRFSVPRGQRYVPADLAIEGDYSSASYFFAAAAVVPGAVEVRGLDPASLQGDARFLRLLMEMGCAVEQHPDVVRVTGPTTLAGIDADLATIPDVAPTLAAVALFARGPTRITGVPHLRVKESDRIAVLCEAVQALGGQATPAPDGLTVRPGALRGARIDPHRDHRIAMAFAIAGLRIPGVTISDPGCVVKSYPSFWEDLDQLISTR